MSRVSQLRTYLSGRQTAYKVTFNDVAGQTVLKDLASFCRANSTCFHPDPRVHSLLEGRREVWLRICEHLNLTEDQLAELHIPQRKIENE